MTVELTEHGRCVALRLKEEREENIKINGEYVPEPWYKPLLSPIKADESDTKLDVNEEFAAETDIIGMITGDDEDSDINENDESEEDEEEEERLDYSQPSYKDGVECAPDDYE